jgi:hypothetical protein
VDVAENNGEEPAAAGQYWGTPIGTGAVHRGATRASLRGEGDDDDDSVCPDSALMQAENPMPQGERKSLHHEY